MAGEIGDAAGAEDAAFFELAGDLPGRAKLDGEFAEMLAPVEFYGATEAPDGGGVEREVMLGFVALIEGMARCKAGKAMVGGLDGETEWPGDALVGLGATVETAAQLDLVAEDAVF